MTSHFDAQGSEAHPDAFSVSIVSLGTSVDGPLWSNIMTLGSDLERGGLTVTQSRDGDIAHALSGACEKVLVFIPSLEHMVAELIETGVAPSVALEKSLGTVEDVLNLYRKNRRKICLVEAGHFAQAEMLVAAISERLGLAEALGASTYKDPERAGPLYMTLAAQCVAASPEASKAKGELEASCLAVGMLQDSVDFDEAFAVLQALSNSADHTDVEDHSDKIDALKAEVAAAKSFVRSKEKVLNEAFDRLQEQSEQLDQQTAQLEDQADQLRQQGVQLHEQVERLHLQEAQLAEATGINDQLMSQLKTVQAEMEVHFSAATDQGAQRQGLETELLAMNKKLRMAQAEIKELHVRDEALTARLAEKTHTLQDTANALEETHDKWVETQAQLDAYAHEVEMLKASTSWKLTKPLRRVKDTITPGKP